MSIFISPQDDLETTQIIRMLENAGYREGHDLLVTGKGRNVSEKTIESSIKSYLLDAIIMHEPCAIYGVEIDLKYCTPISHDDFRLRGSRTAIEKVAEKIGHTLTPMEEYISANARGGVPEMARLAAKQGKDMETVKHIIDHIRCMDRIARGVSSPEEEIKADEAVARMEAVGNCLVARLPHNNYKTVTDRLWPGQNVLAVCEDGQAYFAGDKTELARLRGRIAALSAPGQEEAQPDGGQTGKDPYLAERALAEKVCHIEYVSPEEQKAGQKESAAQKKGLMRRFSELLP